MCNHFLETVFTSVWLIICKPYSSYLEATIFLSSSFLRRPQKLMKSSRSIRRYVVNAKSMVKILSIFVAFLENMNFKNNHVLSPSNLRVNSSVLYEEFGCRLLLRQN